MVAAVNVNVGTPKARQTSPFLTSKAPHGVVSYNPQAIEVAPDL